MNKVKTLNCVFCDVPVLLDHKSKNLVTYFNHASDNDFDSFPLFVVCKKHARGMGWATVGGKVFIDRLLKCIFDCNKISSKLYDKMGKNKLQRSKFLVNLLKNYKDIYHEDK